VRFAPVARDSWLVPDDPAGFMDLESPNEAFRRTLQENVDEMIRLFGVPSEQFTNPFSKPIDWPITSWNDTVVKPLTLVASSASSVFKNINTLIQDTSIEFSTFVAASINSGMPQNYHHDLACASPRSGGLAGLGRTYPDLVPNFPVLITPGAKFYSPPASIKLLAQPP
jgi:hypothetical protein